MNDTVRIYKFLELHCRLHRHQTGVVAVHDIIMRVTALQVNVVYQHCNTMATVVGLAGKSFTIVTFLRAC